MNAVFGRRSTAIDAQGLARNLVGATWLGGAIFNALWTVRQSNPWLWLEESPLPIYEWFFGEVVGKNPAAWTIGLIVGEIALGVLTLAHGKWRQIGLICGALFSAFLFSLAVPYTLTMGGFVLLLGWLAHRERSRV